MTPRDIAALGAVRIREGRERKADPALYGGHYEGWVHRDNSSWIYPDRRTSVSPRAAEFAAEIERLRGMLAALEENRNTVNLQLNQHMDEVVSLTGEVERLQAENERLAMAVSRLQGVIATAARFVEQRMDPETLHRYAATGEVAGE